MPRALPLEDSVARCRHRGFTLLELILALGLSVLVMSIIVGLVGMYSSNFTTRGEDIRRVALARAILNMIADDLRATVTKQEYDTKVLEQMLMGSGGSSAGGQSGGGQSGGGQSGGQAGQGGGQSGGQGQSGGRTGGGSGGQSGGGSVVVASVQVALGAAEHQVEAVALEAAVAADNVAVVAAEPSAAAWVARRAKRVRTLKLDKTIKLVSQRRTMRLALMQLLQRPQPCHWAYMVVPPV